MVIKLSHVKEQEDEAHVSVRAAQTYNMLPCAAEVMRTSMPTDVINISVFDVLNSTRLQNSSMKKTNFVLHL